MDAVKEDMQVVGVRVKDTKNNLKWKTVIRFGNHWKGKSLKEKKKKKPDRHSWCLCADVFYLLHFPQMKLMSISEALWLSTSVFWIFIPGLCSYLQSWACSSPTSQVGRGHVSILHVCPENDAFYVSPLYT